MSEIEIYEEKVWIVHDPWKAQDLASFTSKRDAELFAKKYAKREGR